MGVFTQATTPTLTLTLPDTVDLTEAKEVYFTISQNWRKITKQNADLEIYPHEVNVYLTQEETVKLRGSSEAEMQLNWVYANGSRMATEIAKVDIQKNLLPEVLT